MKKFKASILWGRSPYPGQKPRTYEFDTEAELEAFMKGVEEADGWMGYEIVESGYVHDLDAEE